MLQYFQITSEAMGRPLSNRIQLYTNTRTYKYINTIIIILFILILGILEIFDCINLHYIMSIYVYVFVCDLRGFCMHMSGCVKVLRLTCITYD